MKVIIGTREVIKGIEKNLVKRVVLASNAPDFIKNRIIEIASKSSIPIEFDGDEKELGIRVGKPFPVACAGYSE
jgi:ribosomal protein L30E